MPYRRGRWWYIDRRLPGYGRFGPISTRTSRKETAKAIEAMVVTLNDRARYDILALLADHTLDLVSAYDAYVDGRLDALVADRARAREDPSLAEAVETFLASARDPRYRSTFNWILRAAPEDARVSWLADPARIQTLLNSRLAAGMRPATVARDKVAISAFLGHRFGEAHRREILYRRVRVNQPDNGRLRWLSRDEIDRLRDASGDWWVVWCLLLATGIRRGEALALRVEDVDFEAGQLRVWGTKSKAARRRVPLEGEVVALLRGWIAANDFGPADLLFPGLKGFNVWRAWRQCLELAAVRGATIHDLRHTFAVHAVKSGMPLPELQRRLGHARMQETWRYASFVPPETSEHIRVALDRMGLAPNSSPNIEARRPSTARVQSHQPCQNQPRRRGS